MNRIFLAIISIFLLGGTFLVYQASQEGTSLVFLPSQLASGQNQRLERIRVAGRVAIGTIEYNVQPSAELKFGIHDPAGAGPVVPVVYKGLKPDMFAPGRDVIIDGEFSNGVISAGKLLTQCPSKYEPPDPAKMKYK